MDILFKIVWDQEVACHVTLEYAVRKVRKQMWEIRTHWLSHHHLMYAAAFVLVKNMTKRKWILRVYKIIVMCLICK